VRLQVEELAGRKEQQRLEPLKYLNSPKSGMKARRELRRSSVSRQIGRRKRYGPLKNLGPGGAQKEHVGRGDRQPSDLMKKSRQSLDQEELHIV
jgi:hypothetical protein